MKALQLEEVKPRVQDTLPVRSRAGIQLQAAEPSPGVTQD